MQNDSEGLPKLFDINTVLLVMLLVMCGCCFGFLFYQHNTFANSNINKDINVTEFHEPVNFMDSKPAKKGTDYGK